MKKVLYLGTDPSHYSSCNEVTHYPVIHIAPRDFTSFHIIHQFADILQYTHLILTSKNAVKVFMDVVKFYHIDRAQMCQLQWICIGSSTQRALSHFGIEKIMVAKEETQEGVMNLLDRLDLRDAYLFYPRSAKARPTLSCYLKVRQLRHQICDLYDTHIAEVAPLPVLAEFDEVIFTSPSTVEAFFELFPIVPKNVKLVSLGPITARSLERFA
jgi:uroporphyrinogen-III synthase